MIDSILKINGAKFYEVHSYQEVKNSVTGSKGKSYSYLTQVYAVIQPTGTSGSVKGISLQDTTNSGDKKIADYFMICCREQTPNFALFPLLCTKYSRETKRYSEKAACNKKGGKPL